MAHKTRRGAQTQKKSAQAQKYAYVKKRIAKAQGKAKSTGFFYLIAMLAVSALALVFPLLTLKGTDITVELGVMKFWKIFTQVKGAWKANAVQLAVAGVYGLMALILVINVLRGISKLGWLFKKKASKLYGFNRNMYAMDDLGKIFSCSFTSVVVCHLLIVLLANDVTKVKLEMMAYIVLGVGLFFHFVCGLSAGKVSLFETEDGVREVKREVGIGASFLRNLIQIAVVATFAYFLAHYSVIRATVDNILNNGKAALKDFKALIVPAGQVLLFVWFMALASYAFGTKEYDIEAADARGRKAFLVLAIFALLTAGGLVAYTQFVAKTPLKINAVVIAAAALVAVIFELMLINRPKVKGESDDIDLNEYLSANYAEEEESAYPSRRDRDEYDGFAEYETKKRR